MASGIRCSTIHSSRWLCALVVGMVSVGSSVHASDPLALYLTWEGDPTTTMSVQWHTPEGQVGSVVDYRLVGESQWHQQSGAHRPFPHTDRWIHGVALTELMPGADYEFRVAGGGETHRFRTMPADASQPISFVVGGDTMMSETLFRLMNYQVVQTNPMFAVVGGDLAYADGDPAKVDRWFDFFGVWKDTVTFDGRLVPIVPTIGNHEVAGGFAPGDPSKATFFYDLFPTPGRDPGYATLDFGNYMSLILLDSGHIVPVDGEQAEWLDEQLAERREQEVDHIFPVYHVPAYPSVRDFDDSRVRAVREHWTPIFDEYELDLAFEHHDHAYKRTFRLRDGELHPEGVMYIGDGAWGVPVRDVKTDPDETWYMEHLESTNHFILVTILEDSRLIQAIDIEGRIFDEYGYLIPEPNSAAMLLAASLGLLRRRRGRRSARPIRPGP